jgi:hypothetical protein
MGHASERHGGDPATFAAGPWICTGFYFRTDLASIEMKGSAAAYPVQKVVEEFKRSARSQRGFTLAELQ